MKRAFIAAILAGVFLSCGTGGSSCAERKVSPEFDSFRGSFESREGAIAVKSYYRKGMFFRTEYEYESLDFEIPGSLDAGGHYEFESKAKKVFYTNGGQGGQIETSTARGRVVIVSRTPDRITMDLDLTFSNFSAKGHVMQVPASVRRAGKLVAVRGARIY